MLLRANVQLCAFDARRWVIHTPTGHNLLVNQHTADLLDVLLAADTMPQARQQFNEQFRLALSEEAFGRLVTNRFGGYGVLARDGAPDREPAAHTTYLAMRVELLSAAVAALCARPLRPIYTPRYFWGLFATVLLLAAALLWLKPATTDISYWLLAPLVYASIFVHEFGHIAACGQFGIRHGGIGFGFYAYLFPVFYADVSNIWLGSRQQRLITNLAGIASQMLYANALVVIYAVTGWSSCLAAAATVTVLALWQLNPFVRHDGYWLLVDLTNTPNLLDKAAGLLKHFLAYSTLRQMAHGRVPLPTRAEALLLLYGLMNTSLILMFAAYVCTRYGYQVLQFPVTAWVLLTKCTHGIGCLKELSNDFMLLIIFYMLLVKIAINQVVKKINFSIIKK